MYNKKKINFSIALFFMFVIISKQVFPEAFIEPNNNHTPQEVVEIQLLGLQSGDTGKGIEQVWIFAHPNNKRATGPLARFRTLFEMPSYSPLINLQSYSIELINETAVESQFIVSIIADDGISYDYFWALEKVLTGEQAGFWMTTMVSSPRQMSRSS